MFTSSLRLVTSKRMPFAQPRVEDLEMGDAGSSTANTDEAASLVSGRGAVWAAAERGLSAAFAGVSQTYRRLAQPALAIPMALHSASVLGREAMGNYMLTSSSLSPLVAATGVGSIAAINLALSAGLPYLAQFAHHGAVGQVYTDLVLAAAQLRGWLGGPAGGDAATSSKDSPHLEAADLEDIRGILQAVVIGAGVSALSISPPADLVALGILGAGDAALHTVWGDRPHTGWKAKLFGAALTALALVGREATYTHVAGGVVPHVPTRPTVAGACNGTPQNCARPLGGLMAVGTHNTFGYAPQPFTTYIFGDASAGATVVASASWLLRQLGRYSTTQSVPFTQQFERLGVRAAHIELYRDATRPQPDGTPSIMVSHNKFWRYGPALNFFTEIADVLRANPTEFMTIYLSPQSHSDYLNDVDNLLSLSGLANFTQAHACAPYLPPGSKPFSPSGSAPAGSLALGALLHHGVQVQFLYALSAPQTTYTVTRLGDIQCAPALDTPAQPGFGTTTLLNAFPTFAMASATRGMQRFIPAILEDCIQNASTTQLTAPNVVLVNHIKDRHLVDVVDAYNSQEPLVPGLTEVCGR